ncbi:hypothetical protein DPMN_071440 [Dreissena polymorpha]|uniref:Uncharacterized protein n=1 Tax=Dreissena polymorpha TaxID=45954 RepID=A0A9D4BPN2_DREPO|nr:hypothetical protein DPMN_071440 [Dreissena polymorpha]
MSDLNDSDPEVTIRAGFSRGTRFPHTSGAQKDDAKPKVAPEILCVQGNGTRTEVDAEVKSDHEGGGGVAATHGLMREVTGALKEAVSELRVLKGQSHYNIREAVNGDVPIGVQYANERDIEHFGNGRKRVQHVFEGQREGMNVYRQQRDDGYTGRRDSVSPLLKV